MIERQVLLISVVLFTRNMEQEAYFNGNKCKITGVCIIVAEQLNIKTIKYTEVICGRLIAMKFDYHEQFLLMHAFGPNKHEMFLNQFLIEYEEKNLLIGGDDNVVLVPEKYTYEL